MGHTPWCKKQRALYSGQYHLTMNTIISKQLLSLLPNLKPNEKLAFFTRDSGLLSRGNLWLLTNQRLLMAKKKKLEEKNLFEPGEQISYFETGDLQFYGNVHLLTTQRVIVLDVGSKDYLLESIPLSKISQVDICIIRGGVLNTITYGLRINTTETEQPIEIMHGGISTGGINLQSKSLLKQQEVLERFPRKICEAVGLKFAPLRQIASVSYGIVVIFYSKSDLVWPERCAACYETMDGLVYDEYIVESPWLTAYNFGFGLFPRFTYRIPYCPKCYEARFAYGKINRAVKEGWAKSDGAKVELCFENKPYAIDFMHTNNREYEFT